MRKGDRFFSTKQKAEILVVSENEATREVCERYNVSSRSIFNWRSQLPTNKELQKEYEKAKYEYESSLLVPTRLAYKAYLSRLRSLGGDPKYDKGRIKEMGDVLKTLGEMIIAMQELEEDE